MPSTSLGSPPLDPIAEAVAAGRGTYEASCSSATAAVCLAGQVRSFEQASFSLAELAQALGGRRGRAESVLHIGLQDMGKGGGARHRMSELLPALQRVRASDWQLYSAHDYDPPVLAARASCWSDISGHFSHHFAQMWIVARCLQRALSREAACGRKYEFVARARPDGSFSADALRAVRSLALQNGSRPAAWMTRGVGADRFFVLSRAAVPVMLRGLLDAFSITNCGGQTAPHWHGDRSACSDAHVGSVSTECMIITMLRRGGVALHFDTRLHSDLVPNANGTGRGRRLAAHPAGSRSALPRARLRRDEEARQAQHEGTAPVAAAAAALPALAILMCGQTRALSLPPVLHNVHASLARLRDDADLFLAIDRSVAGNKSAKARLSGDALANVLARLRPTNHSVVGKSAGQDLSLVRGRQLMQWHERRRGVDYAWVMRLRPDMAFTHPFPPLAAWPQPKSPTLYTDYIGSGDDGTACSATPHILPELLANHGVCADDNWGFMSRSVVNDYFAHWYWHASCAGTRLLPSKKRERKRRDGVRVPDMHPVGLGNRLGCIECRLGCMMHRAMVRVAALPAVGRGRMIVRGSRPKETVRAQLAEAAASNETMEVGLVHAFDRVTGVEVPVRV